MFDFLKKNIIYIAVSLAVLDFTSCLFTGMRIDHLFVFLIVLAFSIIVFFMNCMLIHKGYVSDKGVFVLFCHFLLSIIFCMASFIKKDGGFTFMSIAAGVHFSTEFILIKIFDIKEY